MLLARPLCTADPPLCNRPLFGFFRASRFDARQEPERSGLNGGRDTINRSRILCRKVNRMMTATAATIHPSAAFRSIRKRAKRFAVVFYTHSVFIKVTTDVRARTSVAPLRYIRRSIPKIPISKMRLVEPLPLATGEETGRAIGIQTPVLNGYCPLQDLPLHMGIRRPFNLPPFASSLVSSFDAWQESKSGRLDGRATSIEA